MRKKIAKSLVHSMRSTSRRLLVFALTVEDFLKAVGMGVGVGMASGFSWPKKDTLPASAHQWPSACSHPESPASDYDPKALHWWPWTLSGTPSSPHRCYQGTGSRWRDNMGKMSLKWARPTSRCCIGGKQWVLPSSKKSFWGAGSSLSGGKNELASISWIAHGGGTFSLLTYC